ncbi:MAG: NAD(+) diphosphatase [Syntrophotaleaceae bacterium]
MNASPDFFLSPCHLPFNHTCLQQFFQLAPPDADPGGEDGVWIVLRGSELLLQEAALPNGVLPGELIRSGGTPLFMGHWQGKPCRLLEIDRIPTLPSGWRAENLPDWHSLIPIEPLTLAGTAAQILHWERTSRYCSICGGGMERLPREWGKRCRECGYSHFPHIHPCAIVLVRRPGELLLVRKAEWPRDRYSLVSGFVEFGECLEEAAVREVEEETGIRVAGLEYVGSQCWPFPSQLMAGFVAEYSGGDLQVDLQELEDARWFPVDRLPKLPPKRSISRYLIDHHLKIGDLAVRPGE